MDTDILSTRKRILAKVMAVDDSEVLKLVDSLLDQPCCGVCDPDEVGRLMRTLMRVLTGASNN